MTPFELLLYLLAATAGAFPLLVIVAVLVNLVVNNAASHRERLSLYGVTDTGKPARDR